MVSGLCLFRKGTLWMLREKMFGRSTESERPLLPYKLLQMQRYEILTVLC